MPLSTITNRFTSFIRWFDAYAVKSTDNGSNERTIDWFRCIPFIALHLAALLVVFVGWSPIAVCVAVVLYLVRMFAITAFYHRYFSHKAFRTSRVLQFIFALIGASAAQRGPLWWASHHRTHHVHSDQEQDIHSPGQKGFLWSHLGWFLASGNFRTRLKHIADFARYPELRFIDRFDSLVPLALVLILYISGESLAYYLPDSETSGWQMVIWGFVISTLFLYHITFTINSLAHGFGKRRFQTRDDSRNNWFLALLTFGEGWHNNHHYYPGSARQGFVWWEIDISYYLLRLMQSTGLIWGLRPVPQRVLSECYKNRKTHSEGNS